MAEDSNDWEVAGSNSDPASTIRIPDHEVSRQAVSSLRGYVYQIYQSLLAWISLSAEETLFLEVAEDFAIVARDALTAIQVKDAAASGSVTLRSKSIRDAIQSLWNFQQANPSKLVRFRYLTTATIGQEKSFTFPGNKRGLHFWRDAARENCDIKPLRLALESIEFSADLKSFIASAQDEQLRDCLFRRINWDCGQEDSGQLADSIRGRLICLGEQHGCPPSDSKRAVNALLVEVLRVVIKGFDRRLTRADMLSCFEKATSVSVPISILRNLVGSNPMSGGIATTDLSVLGSVVEEMASAPLPHRVVAREALVDELRLDLGRTGRLWLHGSSGTGKTVLAQLITRKSSGKWRRIDLRGLSAESVERRLHLARQEFANTELAGLVIDDLPVGDMPNGRARLSILSWELARLDASLIITSARPPSPTLRDCLGNVPLPVTQVPYLRESEVADLVVSAGGDSSRWARVIHINCGFGHPQLVAARISGLVGRNWPLAELFQGLDPDAGPATDLDDERSGIRASLLRELPNDARELLYRLAVVVGPFDRSLAIAIGEVKPELPRPGELLDLLSGAWVELRAADRFTISPLVSDGGSKTLTSERQNRVRRRIVDNLLLRRPFPADFLGLTLTHSLLSDHKAGLTWLAGAVFCAGKDRRVVAKELSILLDLGVEQGASLFPKDRRISAMLRLAQVKVAAILLRDRDELGRIVERLWSEIKGLPEGPASKLFRTMAIVTILMERDIEMLPDAWMSLLSEFQRLIVDAELPGDLSVKNEAVRAGLGGCALDQFLFAIHAASLHGIQDLDRLLVILGALEPSERNRYLSTFSSPGMGIGLMVTSAWLAEVDAGNPDGEKIAAKLAQFAETATQWGQKALAAECYSARAVMLDEYAHDSTAALAALDEADQIYPAEPTLKRRRAGVHYRNQDHQSSLRAVSEISTHLQDMSPIDKAFFLREAGISAAHMGQLREAAQHFSDAESSAELAGEQLRCMAIGLLADQAVVEFERGNREMAMELIARAYLCSSSIDAEVGPKEKYCLALLDHTVMWLRLQMSPDPQDRVKLAVAFGACSNPAPSVDFQGRIVTPRILLWYQLATLEATLRVNQGMLAELRRKLAGGIIVPLEAALLSERISCGIVMHDYESVLANLHGFMSTTSLTFQDTEAVYSMDFTKPPIVVCDPASDADWMDGAQRYYGTDAVLAFVTRAHLDGCSEVCTELRKRLDDVKDASEALGVLWLSIENGQPACTDLICSAAACVKKWPEDHRVWDPADLCRATCSIWWWLSCSRFRLTIVDDLIDRIVAAWSDVAENRAFTLRIPRRTLPAIRSALNNPSRDLKKLASIALAVEPALDISLSPEIRKKLRESLER